MDRKEIKELAKSKIKGNMWNIWWPFLVITVLQSLVSKIFGANIEINVQNLSSLAEINVPTSYYVKTILIGVVFGVITAGYIRKYDQKNNKFAIVLFNGMRDKILALKDLAIIVNYTSYKDSLGTITKLVIVGDNSSTNTDEAEVASAVEAE